MWKAVPHCSWPASSFPVACRGCSTTMVRCELMHCQLLAHALEDVGEDTLFVQLCPLSCFRQNVGAVDHSQVPKHPHTRNLLLERDRRILLEQESGDCGCASKHRRQRRYPRTTARAPVRARTDHASPARRSSRLRCAASRRFRGPLRRPSLVNFPMPGPALGLVPGPRQRWQEM